MHRKIIPLVAFLVVMSCGTTRKVAPSVIEGYDDQHRPQIHFSPKEKWMNDPNGMVFFNNTYHLFYQYYPDSTVWGPMHWGHATSSDLMHWQAQPVALFPDSLGYIFSGSAVVDINNTSGFGSEGKIPLVAIFTHHDPDGEKAGRTDYQNQSIAYSLDDGKTWVKYEGNPVLKNTGVKDFRDPKVRWHEESGRWIMALATLDRISFYSSPDLKTWEKESEFGEEFGAHGGVWECPDLFPIQHNGENIWVLLVSINPGGPNGGSATQYFTGEFDGKNFTPFQTDTRWIDYGPDNYAGVTFSNTGDRNIFMGWMNNWQYANLVPTQKWRGATTLPRDLSLEKITYKYFIRSLPARELDLLAIDSVILDTLTASNFNLSSRIPNLHHPAKIDFRISRAENFSVTMSNIKDQEVEIGYDKAANEFYIDRSRSGKVDFENGFAAKHTAPRISDRAAIDFSIVIDHASVELFADSGLSVMTSTFFPDEKYSEIRLNSPAGMTIDSLKYRKLKSIYNNP